MMCEFAETDQIELLFQEEYRRLAEVCELSLGWNVLLPLADADRHYLQALRVPATDEQKEFDELVLAVAKVLIDSLNDEKLTLVVRDEDRPNLGASIAKLEAALLEWGVRGSEEHVGFLRTLQALRSTGSAHRKGRGYKGVVSRFGVESKSLREVFREILKRGTAFLAFLRAAVGGGPLGKK